MVVGHFDHAEVSRGQFFFFRESALVLFRNYLLSIFLYYLLTDRLTSVVFIPSVVCSAGADG